MRRSYDAKKLARRKRRPAELLLVPMIDIFTVLVTFLLMTAVFSRTVVLQLNLPAQQAEFKEPPPGLQLEVLEDAADSRKGWTTKEISADVTTRGFHGPVLSVREVAETERFFVDALGFRKAGVDGAYHRFEVGSGGAAKTVTLVHEPNRPAGSWTFGAGTAHHLALEVESDEKLTEQKGLYEELGYTDCSEIKDRNYFHSIYCRCPGGILVECAATAPGAFARDEAPEELGTHLLLPPWFEERRKEILAMLEPIQVPEGNLPKGGTKATIPASPAAAAGQASGSAGASRRSPVFVGGDTPKQ